MTGWSETFNLTAIVQNLISTALWILFASLLAAIFYRLRRKIHPVRIQVRKIEGPELARTRPGIVIATFSGYPGRHVPHLTPAEFKEALESADLTRLPLSSATQSIGQTVRLLDTYRASLRELFLITTVSKTGSSSIASVPLLKKYAAEHNPQLVIHAEEEYAVSLDEDTQVAESAHAVARNIFDRLLRENRYEPDRSAILVDVTGGPRSMTVGVLLACLRPDQDIHLVGSRYDAGGNPDPATSFPMVIHFEPDLQFK